MADLMRAIPTDLPVSVDFLAITPYGPDTRHTVACASSRTLTNP